MDHSVRWSMKNAASCVKRCEMQDTPSTWFSNAYCSLGSFPGLRLSEGRYEIKHIVQVCCRVCRYITVAVLVRLIPTPDHKLSTQTLTRSSSCVVVRTDRHIQTARTLHVLPVDSVLFNSRKRDALLTQRTLCLVSDQRWLIDSIYRSNQTTYLSTSDQARLPAKFKHINKRWKRNQKGYPE